MTEQGIKPETEDISDRLVRLARAANGDSETARAESAMTSAATDPARSGSNGDPPPAWADGPAGRLVERWLPGGARAAHRLRSAGGRRRGLTMALAVAVVAAIGMVIGSTTGRPATEAAPSLPAAVSAMASASSGSTGRAAAGSAASSAQDGPIVVSVVGKVSSQGLVRLPGGARVADALRAAGGALPAVDLSTLNLARRLSDGEQIYVGIPVPPGVEGNVVDSGGDPANSAAGSGSSGSTVDPDPGPAAGTPKKRSKKGHQSGGSGGADAPSSGKVNLNTATADELEMLPGVGPATAQRILTWRSQHGQFSSVGDLREVGGIGDAKLANLQGLVTT
ncbi:MAG TPA: ComEA family DNA-binding protein [Pseudonocardiaceae bacterium]|nr:ComEA family DNA-binding protein [Pseudonocardiaceae bacterium]